MRDYTFCETIQTMIPLPERIKLASKVLLVFIATLGVIYGFVCFYAYLWLQWRDASGLLLIPLKFGSPMPLLGAFDYAGMTGVCLGYLIKYSPAVLRGYKTEKRLPSHPSGEYANRLLPERCQIRITEEVPETDAQDLDLFSPPKISPDVAIPCEVVEIRGETPVYGPPEARRTLAEQVLQIVISFFDRLTLCLKRSDGLSKYIALNARRRALVAYLATRAAGAKVLPREMLKKMYYGLTKDSLYTDKSDIQREVKEACLQLAPDRAPISLFRRRQNKRDYTELALSPNCLVSIPDALKEEQIFIQHVKEHPTTIHHPGLKKVRQDTEEYIRVYGRGFLAHDLEADNQLLPLDRRWSWALPLFRQHRRFHLDFLAYAAWREHVAIRKATTCEEKRTSWRQLQKIHRASAFAAIIVEPESEHGERELQRFLVACLRLHDSKAAREMFALYSTQMRQSDPSWEPTLRTSQLLAAMQKPKTETLSG